MFLLGFGLKKYSKETKYIFSVISLMVLPIIIINGSYFPTFNGASPRYVLSVIPVSCVFSGALIHSYIRAKFKNIFNVVSVMLIFWHLILYYPFPLVMNKIPKFGFLASYAPYFQKFSYHNFPNFSSALAIWVNKNTKPDANNNLSITLISFFLLWR